VAVTHADSYQLQFIMIEKVFWLKCLSFFAQWGSIYQLDGDTNLKYKLLGFLTPNKKIKEKDTSF
jgi:hypothetical protein